MAHAARRTWSRFIKKVYEVDPLLCPRCGEEMRIIAFLEEPKTVEKILRHVTSTTGILLDFTLTL